MRSTTTAIWAGVAYAVSVYVAGFVLGAMRVTLLVPRLGATSSVLLEAPVILAISWILSRTITRRLDVNPDLLCRALMGGVAFAVLIALEFAVSALILAPGSAFLAQYGTAPGLIGLAAQIAFALFPLAQARRPR